MTHTGRLVLGRILWVGAILAGLAYFVLSRADLDGASSDPALIALKGAGMALLALWVSIRLAMAGYQGGGWLLVGYLCLCALGDVLIDAVSLEAGGAAFFAAHMLAIALYLPNRRAILTPSQRGLAMLLVPASLIIGWLCIGDQDGAMFAFIYLGAVALMATCAWISRFPRYRTGIGAVMFLGSDLLIFGQMGPLAGSVLPSISIWPLYFIGQALITAGVVQALSQPAQTVQAAG